MKISIILALFLLNTINCLSQTLIWSEDFQSYADGTQNAVKWTTSAGNCDNDGAPSNVFNSSSNNVGNYWGVRTTSGDKEFCCNDIEGLTCCTSSEGASDNSWTSENISIAGYSSVSIYIDMRAVGNMECNACGSGRDQFTAQYRVNGGAWTNFLSVCGLSSGQRIIECVDIAGGTTLNIRVLLGNQANEEKYFFDDVRVYDAICSIALPVELISFDGRYNEDENVNEILWSTASESNNERFEIYKSLNGYDWDLIEAQKGAGNSTTQINYQFYDYSIESGLAYYRLEQVDYDGNRTDYEIISIDNIDETVVMVRYYNLMGQEIGSDELFGFIIQETHFKDGKINRELKLFY